MSSLAAIAPKWTRLFPPQRNEPKAPPWIPPNSTPMTKKEQAEHTTKDSDHSLLGQTSQDACSMPPLKRSMVHPHMNRGNDSTPEEDIKPPSTYGDFHLDEAVVEKLLAPGIKIISSQAYGMSLWGKCAKILVELPDSSTKMYFLKISSGPTGPSMCEGEFESMKAINTVSATFAPKPLSWGKYKNEEVYFMMSDYRAVGRQPPEAAKFATRLADLHKNSKSPTGKFGFHTTTCHGVITQITDTWEDSWAKLYQRQLAHMFAMDLEKHGPWPEFEDLCQLILSRVIPRLLDPLQSEGRSIKPCLVHGDCWDENTATDMETGEPFIFDAGSFYAHNEYDLGNWRAPRHRLSRDEYMVNYQRNFGVSEPVDDWDGRNLLYSLRFNIGTAILIPDCNQREVVHKDMKELLRTYCADSCTMVTQKCLKLSLRDDVDGKVMEEEEEE